MTEKVYKILVAEDEKPMAHALQLKLGHTGFKVQIAADGEEALEILKKDSVDLMILDLIMPKIDGFGVLVEMKKRKDKTPVIIASNLSQDEDFDRAKEFGAVDFFVKSDVSINQLVKNIEKILKK